METTVFLIRHGNVECPIGPSNEPLVHRPEAILDSQGVYQVLTLAEWFRSVGIRFYVIHTSPTPRALETARMISDNSENIPPIRENEGLRATRTPSLDGKPLRFLTSRTVFTDESISQVRERVVHTFDDIRRQDEGKTIAIVTHAEEIGVLTYVLQNPGDIRPLMCEPIEPGTALRMVVGEARNVLESERIVPRGFAVRRERG